MRLLLLCQGFAAMLSLLPLTGDFQAAFAQEARAERGVPYFTLRNRTGSSEPDKFYGDERSDLKAGWCDVDQTRLGALSPVAEAAPFRIPDEILRVDSIIEVPDDAVLDRLSVTAAGRPPVFYTHGFYIDFEKGCRRATLFQENANLEGRFLWFSWPSDGALLNYTRDEADLYWSVPDLADTIARLENRFGAGQVHVVGHSLGARGVVLALYEVANSHTEVRLGEVVLLAPDMDFDMFRKILPRIRPIARNITVYVTSGDRPLALSAEVHGYPRLGEAGNDVASLTGVEVIDLSDLPARSPSGHLYHIYDALVGDDLDQLLNEEKDAGARRNLTQIANNLWMLQRAD